VDLRNKLDPNKLFWNDYLERLFGDGLVHAQSPTPEEDTTKASLAVMNTNNFVSKL